MKGLHLVRELNTGYSNSENMSKTKGTNTSTGSSQSKTVEQVKQQELIVQNNELHLLVKVQLLSSQNVSKDIINKKQ